MSTPVARSLAEMFRMRVEATPDRVAFLYPTDPGWGTLTWRDVERRVRAIACGLRALGLDDEQRCAILATTRLDWVLCDLGIMCAGGGDDHDLPLEYVRRVRLHPQRRRVPRGVRRGCARNSRNCGRSVPSCRTSAHVVVIDGPADDDGWAMTLEGLMTRGRATTRRIPAATTPMIDRVTPQSLATLVYTSGTTGRPKGAELIHDCWFYEARAIDELGSCGSMTCTTCGCRCRTSSARCSRRRRCSSGSRRRSTDASTRWSRTSPR